MKQNHGLLKVTTLDKSLFKPFKDALAPETLIVPEVKVESRTLKMRYQLVEDALEDNTFGAANTSQQNVSAFYSQPDCFICLYRVL